MCLTKVDELKTLVLHAYEDYHEDDGTVLWWVLPIVEPPYVGSTLDVDFPWGMDDPPPHLYWTLLPEVWRTGQYQKLVAKIGA